ncbi:unnamed protein product [Protopolystoma xenopodis]|uniref:Uncharacterized protein n=1 Tax=Protopolystoma xenopodis TaxID=117903 RepID=A0A3S5AJW5_9PLAT|nr:unnamed protein product [Protopolystoma xenopodis]
MDAMASPSPGVMAGGLKVTRRGETSKVGNSQFGAQTLSRAEKARRGSTLGKYFHNV